VLQAAAALAIEPPEFAAEQLIQADGSDLQVDAYSVPEVADWDADGLADLIVGEKFSTSLGKVRIYLNTGTAAAPVYATSFYAQAEGAELTVPASGCLGVFPQVTDFDYDGRKDLLLGLADGRVQVRINQNTDAAPLFGPESYVQAGLPGSGQRQLRCPGNPGGGRLQQRRTARPGTGGYGWQGPRAAG